MNVHRTPFACTSLILIASALFPKVATAQYSAAQCALVGRQIMEVREAINRHVKERTLNGSRRNFLELRDGWIDRYQKEATEVMNQRKKIISLDRENLSHCHEYMNRNVYIANLQALAFDLNADKQPEKALGVANKCLEIDAKDLFCLVEKASALANLGRLSEATSISDRASSLGAISEVEAAAKKRLQQVKLLLHQKEEWSQSQIVSRPFVSGPSISKSDLIFGRFDPPSRAEVPLKKDGGTFVVPVLINGAMTLDFTLDSGAADVTVPADAFSTLTRTGTVTDADITGERTYVLADGSQSKSVTFTIRSLRVGDKVVENVRGSVAPAQGNLLLGQSFLERFKSWSFDNTTHQLRLEPQ